MAQRVHVQPERVDRLAQIVAGRGQKAGLAAVGLLRPVARAAHVIERGREGLALAGHPRLEVAVEGFERLVGAHEAVDQEPGNEDDEGQPGKRRQLHRQVVVTEGEDPPVACAQTGGRHAGDDEQGAVDAAPSQRTHRHCSEAGERHQHHAQAQRGAEAVASADRHAQVEPQRRQGSSPEQAAFGAARLIPGKTQAEDGQHGDDEGVERCPPDAIVGLGQHRVGRHGPRRVQAPGDRCDAEVQINALASPAHPDQQHAQPEESHHRRRHRRRRRHPQRLVVAQLVQGVIATERDLGDAGMARAAHRDLEHVAGGQQQARRQREQALALARARLRRERLGDGVEQLLAIERNAQMAEHARQVERLRRRLHRNAVTAFDEGVAGTRLGGIRQAHTLGAAIGADALGAVDDHGRLRRIERHRALRRRRAQPRLLCQDLRAGNGQQQRYRGAAAQRQTQQAGAHDARPIRLSSGGSRKPPAPCHALIFSRPATCRPARWPPARGITASCAERRGLRLLRGLGVG